MAFHALILRLQGTKLDIMVTEPETGAGDPRTASWLSNGIELQHVTNFGPGHPPEQILRVRQILVNDSRAAARHASTSELFYVHTHLQCGPTERMAFTEKLAKPANLSFLDHDVPP